MAGSGDHIVLVPYYRGLDYLRTALESLIAQTDPTWSAIVVDDSPTDAQSGQDSEAVARLLSELGDPRITSERPVSPLGVAGAFNRCFELAAASEAKYATIFHADDELAPAYLEEMSSAHRVHPDAVCVAPKVEVIDEYGRPCQPLGDRVKAAMWPRTLDRLSGDRGLARLLHGQFLYCPSVSYRTNVVAAVRWDGRWQQVMDLDLFARLLLSGCVIALCGQPVYRYRRHGATTTALNTATLLRLEEESKLIHQLAQVAAGHGWKGSVRAGRVRATVRLHGLLQAWGFLRARAGRNAVAALRLSVCPKEPNW